MGPGEARASCWPMRGARGNPEPLCVLGRSPSGLGWRVRQAHKHCPDSSYRRCGAASDKVQRWQSRAGPAAGIRSRAEEVLDDGREKEMRQLSRVRVVRIESRRSSGRLDGGSLPSFSCTCAGTVPCCRLEVLLVLELELVLVLVLVLLP
jgi:hypothetical protein